MAENKTVLIVPCSGIGKVHGLMAREATYQAIDKVGADLAATLCLALLVSGDEEAVQSVRSSECIAVDGCVKLCARKNIENAGGEIRHHVRVVDAFRRHPGARPGRADSLTEEGWQITSEIAEELAAAARKVSPPKEGKS